MITTTLAAFPSPSQGVWYLGPVPIRAYAVFIIIGIIVALLIGDRRWAARGGERGVIYDIALWAVPFGLIGGRLYHVLTDWKTYFGPGGGGPVAALRVWDGGLGIWGAVALGGVGAWIACRRRGIPLPAFGDAVAPGIVLAQAIGRIGNYFNQELYGRETTVPWGMEIFYRLDPSGIIDVHSLNGVSTGQVAAVVHPTFLYELLWNLLVFVILILVDRKFKIGHGRLFALYVALYCVGRFGIELLRDDTATQIAGIRINSFTATFVFLAAVVYIILAKKGREDPATLGGREKFDGGHAPELARELAVVASGTGVVAAATVAGWEDTEPDDPKTTEVLDTVDELEAVDEFEPLDEDALFADLASEGGDESPEVDVFVSGAAEGVDDEYQEYQAAESDGADAGTPPPEVLAVVAAGEESVDQSDEAGVAVDAYAVEPGAEDGDEDAVVTDVASEDRDESSEVDVFVSGVDDGYQEYQAADSDGADGGTAPPEVLAVVAPVEESADQSDEVGVAGDADAVEPDDVEPDAVEPDVEDESIIEAEARSPGVEVETGFEAEEDVIDEDHDPIDEGELEGLSETYSQTYVTVAPVSEQEESLGTADEAAEAEVAEATEADHDGALEVVDEPAPADSDEVVVAYAPAPGSDGTVIAESECSSVADENPTIDYAADSSDVDSESAAAVEATDDSSESDAAEAATLIEVGNEPAADADESSDSVAEEGPVDDIEPDRAVAADEPEVLNGESDFEADEEPAAGGELAKGVEPAQGLPAAEGAPVRQDPASGRKSRFGRMFRRRR